MIDPVIFRGNSANNWSSAPSCFLYSGCSVKRGMAQHGWHTMDGIQCDSIVFLLIGKARPNNQTYE